MRLQNNSALLWSICSGYQWPGEGEHKGHRDESMSFFADLRAERLIEEVRATGDPQHPNSQKALAKLAKIGPGAIPKVLEAVASADKRETVAYVEILSQWADNKNFPALAEGLEEGNPRAIAAVTWEVSSSRN